MGCVGESLAHHLISVFDVMSVRSTGFGFVGEHIITEIVFSTITVVSSANCTIFTSNSFPTLIPFTV